MRVRVQPPHREDHNNPLFRERGLLSNCALKLCLHKPHRNPPHTPHHPTVLLLVGLLFSCFVKVRVWVQFLVCSGSEAFGFVLLLLFLCCFSGTQLGTSTTTSYNTLHKQQHQTTHSKPTLRLLTLTKSTTPFYPATAVSIVRGLLFL